MLNVSIDVSFSMVGQPKTMDGFRSFLALHATLFDCLNVCLLVVSGAVRVLPETETRVLGFRKCDMDRGAI